MFPQFLSVGSLMYSTLDLTLVLLGSKLLDNQTILLKACDENFILLSGDSFSRLAIDVAQSNRVP